MEYSIAFKHAVLGRLTGVGFSKGRVHQLRVSSSAARDSLQSARWCFLNRRLHLDFAVIRKAVEIGWKFGAQ